MKSIVTKTSLFLLGLFVGSSASADRVLYEGQYSHTALAHYKGDGKVLYEGQYSYSALAHDKTNDCSTNSCYLEQQR